MSGEQLNLFGVDLYGDPIAPKVCKLARDFVVPPFSVLDARAGYWQERKRAWLALGIKSELGRGQNALGFSEQAPGPGLNHYRDEKKHTASLGAGLTVHTTTDPYRVGRGDAEPSAAESGTSIFDPVLCELAYHWFCPPGGAVLDPFAGGSVRGIVAAKLGHRYTGIDLRPEQCAANEEQAAAITPGAPPLWLTGDSRDVARLAPGAYDFVFSCPPYFDLEWYSYDPADLSNAPDYGAFLSAYRTIIAACCGMLRADRFACFVVGDIRDRKGFYRNFVGDTVAAFAAAGLKLYNDAVLVTQIGSLPIRVGGQFPNYRKLGKTHQNVLVFYNGDPASIKPAFRPEAEGA